MVINNPLTKWDDPPSGNSPFLVVKATFSVQFLIMLLTFPFSRSICWRRISRRTVQQFRGQKLFSCRSFPNKSRLSQLNLKITEDIFLEWATAIPAMKKPGDFTTFRAGETAHMFAAEIHIFFSDGIPMNPFHSWTNPMGFQMIPATLRFQMIPATLRSIFHHFSPCFPHFSMDFTMFFPMEKNQPTIFPMVKHHRGDQLRAESEALKRQALKLQTEQVRCRSEIFSSKNGGFHGSSPLVNIQKNWKIAIDIVELPMKNGDFNSYVNVYRRETDFLARRMTVSWGIWWNIQEKMVIPWWFKHENRWLDNSQPLVESSLPNPDNPARVVIWFWGRVINESGLQQKWGSSYSLFFWVLSTRKWWFKQQIVMKGDFKKILWYKSRARILSRQIAAEHMYTYIIIPQSDIYIIYIYIYNMIWYNII